MWRGQGGVPSVRGKLLEASTAIVKIIGHENVIYSSQIKWQFCGIYLRICSGVNSWNMAFSGSSVRRAMLRNWWRIVVNAAHMRSKRICEVREDRGIQTLDILGLLYERPGNTLRILI